MSDVATKDGSFRLRVATETLARWRAAAESEGISLSRWVTESCDAAEAEISDTTMRDEQIRLERSQMIAEAKPQSTRPITPPRRKRRPAPERDYESKTPVWDSLPSHRHQEGPDWK